MKQMILTGLATEQKFGEAEQRFYLVFNDGELKVPASPEAAEVVVQAMYGDNGVSESPPAFVERDEDEMHPDPEDLPQA
jgi:hypothetical protein